MKVERITYAELKSGPGYNNRKAEATVVLEEGDTPEAAVAKAKEIVAEALKEPERVVVPPSDDWYDWTEGDVEPDEDDEEGEEDEDYVSLKDEEATAETAEAKTTDMFETQPIRLVCSICGRPFEQVAELLAHTQEAHSSSLQA